MNFRHFWLNKQAGSFPGTYKSLQSASMYHKSPRGTCRTQYLPDFLEHRSLEEDLENLEFSSASLTTNNKLKKKIF